MLGPEALSDSSDLPEVLWYFSHFLNDSRLVLAQNPHFYTDLPTSPAKYVRRFSSHPTVIFQGVVDVLTSNVRRVFFECTSEPRIFDNVWAINGILIFKGSCVGIFFSPRLISLQTLPEGSRAKPSSDDLFQTFPSSGLAWSIQNRNLKWLGI
jgi:hypothetical protein